MTPGEARGHLVESFQLRTGLGDAKHLAWVDHARVAQHRAIGLEDLVVSVGIAVKVLGNNAERAARLHGVHPGGIGRRFNIEVFVDLLDTLDIANGGDNSLECFLVRNRTFEVDHAVVETNVDVATHAQGLEVFLEFVGLLGLGTTLYERIASGGPFLFCGLFDFGCLLADVVCHLAGLVGCLSCFGGETAAVGLLAGLGLRSVYCSRAASIFPSGSP
jgi:hypothetical protein